MAARTTFSPFSFFHSFGLKLHIVGKLLTHKLTHWGTHLYPKADLSLDSPVSSSCTPYFLPIRHEALTSSPVYSFSFTLCTKWTALILFQHHRLQPVLPVPSGSSPQRFLITLDLVYTLSTLRFAAPGFMPLAAPLWINASFGLSSYWSDPLSVGRSFFNPPFPLHLAY